MPTSVFRNTLRGTLSYSSPPSRIEAAPRPHLVELQGHLTLSSLEQALGPLSVRVHGSQTRPSLIFDCQTMTGYDKAARERFVQWHRSVRPRIGQVAVVTSNPLWHVVVAAMSLAAGHPMRAFSSIVEAASWLDRSSGRAA